MREEEEDDGDDDDDGPTMTPSAADRPTDR